MIASKVKKFCLAKKDITYLVDFVLIFFMDHCISLMVSNRWPMVNRIQHPNTQIST